MTISFNTNGLGFATLTKQGGAITTVALLGVAYSPNVGKEPFRSGGDLSASMMRRTGGRPGFRIRMPLASAWGILGSFLPVQLSECTMYEASFTGTPLLRVGTGATTVGLTPTTGVAIAYISRIFPQGGGAMPLMVAEIIVLLCATDGTTDPVTVASGSLPALAANPTLHTLGPMVDDTTTRWATQAWSLDTGLGMEAIQNDGFFYPLTYRNGAIQAAFTIMHNDPVTLHAALGDSGKDVSGVGLVLWARAYDAAAKSLLDTGYSFTMAKGLASLEQIELEGTDRAIAAVQVASYAAAGTLTYPIAVATSGTLPT